jgi:RNA ligase (TIGR02306 family)
MASFEVSVTRIDAIEVHPNADAIEIAVIAGFRCIVKKEQFKQGNLVIYIPEAALVPNWLLEDLGLVDKLSGPNKNRVRAIRLRGIFSQGLLIPLEYLVRDPKVGIEGPFWRDQAGNMQGPVSLGQDLSEDMGIDKWEPTIPANMAGEVCNIFGKTLKFDIENIQKNPDILKENESVAFAEKLHGTWCCMALYPRLNHPELFFDGNVFVCSKGLGSQGLVFKNNDNNKNNLYVRTLMSKNSENIIMAMNDIVKRTGLPIYILGEIFGTSVQDLGYGTKDPLFRVFDVYLGKPGQGRYLDFEEKEAWLAQHGIPMVPVLYKGPFSLDIVPSFRDGKETVSGQELNIREGIVITPFIERQDDNIGRVILKAVSPNYLLRKGNTTEYQ